MMFPFVRHPSISRAASDNSESGRAVSDDDRAELRVLYPDASDTTHVGTISGRILPQSAFPW